MKGNPNKKERIGLEFMQMAREQKNRGIQEECLHEKSEIYVSMYRDERHTKYLGVNQ